jgi:streptogramin lyase
MPRVFARSIARRAALAAGVGLLASSALAQSLTETWRLGGLSQPESAFFHEETGRIVVSQMGAPGPDAGTDGRLSLISSEGEMIEADWVTGLVDPKGMASHEGRLYVADLGGLHVVDMATGQLSDLVEMPDAVLLNDVTVDADGTVYVSDIVAGAIYRLQGGAVDQVVEAGGVSLPNGLLARDGSVLVGSFGQDWTGELSLENPGGLLTLDLATGEVTQVPGTETSGRVDGIAPLGDWLIFGDYQTGRILGWRDDTLTPLAETAPTAADLGSTGELLLVPVTDTGEVIAFRLEEG